MDISNADLVQSLLERANPEVVINCAAYTAVDAAETDQEKCYAINSLGVQNLAAACAKLDIKLVQISTDYVFGGPKIDSDQHTEDSDVSPQGTYAKSKYEGELHALSSEKNLVIRTCGLYAHGGKNFVETMLKLGSQRDELSVVNDQLCNPTSTRVVAEGVMRLIDAHEQGLFHVVSSMPVTWFAFAQMIFDQSATTISLTPITTEQYGAPAPRPSCSALSTEKYTRTTGHQLPTIADDLADYLSARND